MSVSEIDSEGVLSKGCYILIPHQSHMKKGIPKEFVNIFLNELLQLRRVVAEIECRMKLVLIVNLDNISRNGLHAPTCCSTLLKDLRAGK
jgi:hypothetical protein